MSVYEFGPFRLDSNRLLLLERDEPLPVGPKVVETLLALLEHPGEVVTKAMLLKRVWPEGYVDEANLAQNIYVLRKVLRARWDAVAIETIPRHGYRFVAAIRSRVPAKGTPIWPLRSARSIAAAVCALVVGSVVLLATAVPHSAPGGGNLSTESARLLAMGQYYWNLRTSDGVAKSVTYFARVIASSPQSARGYAAYAAADAVMADYGYGPESPTVYVARAKGYARRALALDPQCSQAYAVLGMLASERRGNVPEQMPVALADFQRAIALDPANGPAHEWYGIALVQEGKMTAAYGELNKAAELDPLSVATTAWLGTVAYLERRYADAIGYARETLDLSPHRQDAFETLGLAYEAVGDRRHAVTAFGQLGRLCSGCRIEAAALLAALYARAHQLDRARAELAIAQSHPNEVAPTDLAVALAEVGRREAALSWLRHARGQYWQAEVANDPRFAELHLGRLQPVQKPA